MTTRRRDIGEKQVQDAGDEGKIVWDVGIPIIKVMGGFIQYHLLIISERNKVTRYYKRMRNQLPYSISRKMIFFGTHALVVVETVTSWSEAQRMMAHYLCVCMRVCVWVWVSMRAAWVYLYRGGGQQGHIIAANVYRGNCHVCYTSSRGGDIG